MVLHDDEAATTESFVRSLQIFSPRMQRSREMASEYARVSARKLQHGPANTAVVISVRSTSRGGVLLKRKRVLTFAHNQQNTKRRYSTHEGANRTQELHISGLQIARLQWRPQTFRAVKRVCAPGAVTTDQCVRIIAMRTRCTHSPVTILSLSGASECCR